MSAYLLGGSSAEQNQHSAVALLAVRGVHKHYGEGDQTCHALRGIDLQLVAGEIVVICGPSGSGKSTLLNLIAMYDDPSEGSLVINGLLASKLSEQARADLRAEQIGIVFQAFTLIPVMTALENVLLPYTLRRQCHPTVLKQAGARAQELLAQLCLATQMHAYPGHLNASQRQRVAIARALVTEPRLVLADEPGARLNTDMRVLMMERFASACASFGSACLITTRDQRSLGYASRTLQLCDGTLSGGATHDPHCAVWAGR